MKKMITKYLLILSCVFASACANQSKINNIVEVHKNLQPQVELVTTLEDQDVFLKTLNDHFIYYVVENNKVQTLYKFDVKTHKKESIYQIKGVIVDVKELNQSLYLTYNLEDTNKFGVVQIDNEIKVIDEYINDNLQIDNDLVQINNKMCYIKSNNIKLSLNCINGESYVTPIQSNDVAFMNILNNTESVLIVTKTSDSKPNQYQLNYLKDNKFKTIKLNSNADEIQSEFLAILDDYLLMSTAKQNSYDINYYALNLNTQEKQSIRFKDIPNIAYQSMNLNTKTNVSLNGSSLMIYQLSKNAAKLDEITLPIHLSKGPAKLLQFNQSLYFNDGNQIFKLKR